jgi:hypothetical protein
LYRIRKQHDSITIFRYVVNSLHHNKLIRNSRERKTSSFHIKKTLSFLNTHVLSKWRAKARPKPLVELNPVSDDRMSISSSGKKNPSR